MKKGTKKTVINICNDVHEFNGDKFEKLTEQYWKDSIL